ncbi:hypothetical protein [Arthrobacter sp. B2a2-09]|uniref:hypothetical protein n=1 Tax=Arthrobacter sp. B2a2-09 TaxID=2952822 RepID=UPI0022CD383B|nr:hypothetical protein [Arthrobacter sp. B2a2-09]MCZ9883921.1 hypothetical protein [Arthrobacter sp. B2a2-09]
MDAIKNLISATDPLKTDPAAVPDAETVLRQVVTDRSEAVDKMPPNVRSLADARRQRAVRIAGLLTIAAAAVTAGVLVVSNLGALSGAAVPANSGHVTPAPSVTPSASGTPAPIPSQTTALPSPVGERYTSPTTGISFSIPTGWTVTENASNGAAADTLHLDVFNEDRVRVAGIEYGQGGLGGACGPKPVSMYTLDSEPVAIPNRRPGSFGAPEFVYRVLDGTEAGGKVVGAIGLNQEDANTAGKETCMAYTVIYAPKAMLSFATKLQISLGDTRGLIFDSVAEAKAYMGTPEYTKLKEMITSLQLTQ